MYTILVTKDNELLATEKTAIMQRSTMVDKLRFFVPKDYNDEDMSTYDAVIMEYVTPIGHKYESEELEINEFITVLHSNTTAPEEREILTQIKAVE